MFPRIIVAISTSCMSVSTFAGDPSGYIFYDLGYYQAPSISITANAINDHGIIVGVDPIEEDGYEFAAAFAWENGKSQVLGDLGLDYYFSFATGISTAGVIGGMAACNCYPDCEPCDDFHPAFWDDGELVVLPIPEECDAGGYTDLMSPNGRYFVGECSSAVYAGISYGVIYDTLELTATLIAPPGGYGLDIQGYVDDVNDFGVVVGTFFSSDDDADPFTAYKEFMWQNGIVTLIPNLLGEGNADPNNINNKATVSGVAQFIDETSTAFMYKDGVMTNPGYGTTWGLNERDVGVGEVILNFLVHPFRYTLTGSTDLLSYLPSGYHNGSAIDINNYGWIAGLTAYHDDGFQHAWLLIPIYPKGDYDGDDDVDFQDFGQFQECFAAESYQGPEGGLHVGCSVFDFDDDIDLDGQDFAAFQAAFTGPTAPDLNPTGPG